MHKSVNIAVVLFLSRLQSSAKAYMYEKADFRSDLARQTSQEQIRLKEGTSVVARLEKNPVHQLCSVGSFAAWRIPDR